MKVFEKCCCCIPLQVGTIIIGVLALIGSLSRPVSGFNSVGSYIQYVICIIIDGLLIYGAVKKNRKLLIPWLVFTIFAAVGIIVIMILLTCGIAVAGIEVATHDPHHGQATVAGAMIASIIIVCLIVEGFIIFFACVVHSFYCELRDEEANPRSGNYSGQTGNYPNAPVGN